MRLQPRYAAQVAQQLPAGYKLHDEVQITRVLREALELDLNDVGGTMNGWWRRLRIWL